MRFLLLLLLAGCASAPTAPRTGALRVLFVGNSLTIANDLPATFAAIAHAAGDSVVVDAATGGGLALIDHLNGATDAVQRIRASHWDYVVLQQGPTTIGLCRDSTILWTGMFAPLIRNAGGVPALFMVWPASGQPERFPLVHDAYQLAADTVHGVFLPAGDAWRDALEAAPALPLYGGDGFHPAPAGSYLAALTIYESLTKRDARTIPAAALGLDVASMRQLHEAAHRAATAPRVEPADGGHAPPPGGRC